MAKTHETIADIRKDAEAKFRELVEAYMQRRAAFQTTVGAMQAFNTVFDRLEAAWKRDRTAIEADALSAGGLVEAMRQKKATCEKSSAVGDAAKLREVVMALAYAILPPQEKYPAEYGGGKVPDRDGWLAWVRQMQVEARAALATTEKEGGAK